MGAFAENDMIFLTFYILGQAVYITPSPYRYGAAPVKVVRV